MNSSSVAIDKELVLIGGGHAHVSVIKKFGMRPMAGVRLTVISRDLMAPYSGMLPGFVAGHYSLEQCHIDLLPLTRFANARFIHDEVIGLDAEAKQILCKNRPPIDYDVVSINIGSSPDVSTVPGAANEVVPVKPISNFVQHWTQLRERVLSQQGELHIGVVGAGAGGVELTLAMQYRLQQDLLQQNSLQQNSLQKIKADLSLHFHLFDTHGEVLATHNSKVRRKFHDLLRKRQIKLHLEQRIEAVQQGGLKNNRGEFFQLDEILWVTRASAQSWLKSTAIVLNPDGFISVDPNLQSVSHRDVFAAGDIAHVIAHPRPKAGVFAVRQGAPLTRNLRRALKQKSLIDFKPQADFLSLISTGDKCAVASKSNWMFAGKLMWVWKNWIDQRFMDKFKRLPSMVPATKPSITTPSGTTREKQQSDQSIENEAAEFATMYCGGCASKVGKSILQKVLADIRPISSDNVVRGLQQPDDAAVVRVDGAKLQVHTVDHFNNFLDDPYLFGKICAEHALSDLYAMGATPQTALAIVTLTHESDKAQAQDLRQLLCGAVDVLNQAGTALIGGHTNTGEELALGFAINGCIEEEKILSKRGMQAGDKLILTKALGIGTLFAAYMRNKVASVDIENAIVSMLQSNRDAASVAQQYQVNACTDVTGFGLIGHLQEMLGNSQLSVTLSLGSLPVMQGAINCTQQGIVSSLQKHNKKAEVLLINGEQFVNHKNFPLLFDPQTSGGLLTSVPAEQASDCLESLRKAGYKEAVILGSVVAGKTSNPVVELTE